MSMKVLIFFLVAFLPWLNCSASASEKSLIVTGEQMQALILVSEALRKTDCILEKNSFRVEDQGANLVITVTEEPRTAKSKGGMRVYTVSKTEDKILSIRIEK